MANRFGEPGERMTPQDLAAASGVAFWRCPKCGTDWRGETNVQTTWNPKGEQVTSRKRFCRKCKSIVTTKEVAVPEGHKLLVVPMDDDLEARVA